MIEPSSYLQLATDALRQARSHVSSAAAVATVEKSTLDNIDAVLGNLESSTSARELRGAIDDATHRLNTLAEAMSAVRPVPPSQPWIAQALVRLHPALKALDKVPRETLDSLVTPVSSAEVAESMRPRAKPSLVPPDVRDRRTSQRVEIETDIGFASDTNFYTGFSGDISEGGIFVATYELLGIGTPLTLSFVLPGNHQVSATGSVKWLRETHSPDSEIMPGMGVRFDALEPVDQAAIDEFVRVRQPLFYDDDDD